MRIGMFPLNIRRFDQFPCQTFGCLQKSIRIFLKPHLQLPLNHRHGWRPKKSNQPKVNSQRNQLSAVVNLPNSFLKATHRTDVLMQRGKERFLHKIFDPHGKGSHKDITTRRDPRHLNWKLPTIKMAEILPQLPKINGVRMFQVPLLWEEKCR